MSKYKSIRVGKHASKKENRRATELAMMQQAGLISELSEQVKYVLIPKQEGERAVTYTADFRYFQDGAWVVEDSKGFKTQQYVIRRKLMQFIHGIRILET